MMLTSPPNLLIITSVTVLITGATMITLNEFKLEYDTQSMYDNCCDSSICSDTYYDQEKNICHLSLCEHLAFGDGKNCTYKGKDIINELKPKFYIIENPRGMLRKQEFMLSLHRDTVTYCQYGLTIQKPTDLWNNLNHNFKSMCKPGSSCHEKASRSSRNGLQGINNSFSNLGSKGRVKRAIVPKQLCEEILNHIENYKENRSMEWKNDESAWL